MTRYSRFPHRSGSAKSGLLLLGFIAVLLSSSLLFAVRANNGDTPPALVGRITVNAQLSAGTVGAAYGGVLKTTGGQAPYQFVVVRGQVPNGLTLDPHTGAISGTPSVAGAFSFTVRVTDLPDRDRGEANLAISVIKNTPPPPPPGVNVTVSPTAATIASATHQQFAATVTNASNTAVTWTATAGSISASGLFTAPTVTATITATVRATSVADPTKSATALVTVQVQAPPPPVSVSVSPTSATINSAASQQFTAAVQGTSNTGVTWSATAGTIASSGMFTAPTVTANTTATVKATSTADPTKSASATVAIQAQSTPPPPPPPPPPSTGADNRYCQPGDVPSFATKFDGPAQLPTRCVNTALSSTPSTGKTTLVPSGGNVQVALNSAACGDTIQLQAGGTFAPFTLPAKSCDAKHWITIRTSAPDTALPAEGSRLTPCYAGVASLPGRPAYSCSNPKNVLATIISDNARYVTDSPGANYYRFVGLEFTRNPGGTNAIYRLILMAAADHVVFDRVWIHGTARDETVRGLGLGGSTHVAVIDSYLNDFHCIAMTGTCTDAQAIIGGLGSVPGGPYKFVNNFLEASGENILFGGGPATVTPADVEVRRNHMFKPPMWRQGDPSYFGTTFIVKNLFELKNASRVLLEANLMENTWGGFSQFGYGLLLTVRNQSGQCPMCQVTDVTIRYNWISHVGGGMQIANPLTLGAAAYDGGHFSIHDVVIDDINATKFAGNGVTFQISTNTPILHDVAINHITAMTDPTHTSLMIGDQTGTKMLNFSFTNNLMVAGKYAVNATAASSSQCALSGQPANTINNCFSPVSFTANAILGYVPTVNNNGGWPANNYWPSSITAGMLNNYNNGVGGDYRLQSASPYKNAGTDGKDLGADINALNSALAGVP